MKEIKAIIQPHMLSKVMELRRARPHCRGATVSDKGLSPAIKALSDALALAGHASLWVANAADMGVSLSVVANALRSLATGPSQGVPTDA